VNRCVLIEADQTAAALARFEDLSYWVAVLVRGYLGVAVVLAENRADMAE
jgi:hypothetical protein